MTTALITGCTSGFGEAFALRLAKLGYRLIITGRRKNRLERLAERLESQYVRPVASLCFDVRDCKACEKALASLPPEFSRIDLLVNNAGLAAGASPFDESLLDDFERMIDTNIKGLLYMTKLIVPQMIERKVGSILISFLGTRSLTERSGKLWAREGKLSSGAQKSSSPLERVMVHAGNCTMFSSWGKRLMIRP